MEMTSAGEHGAHNNAQGEADDAQRDVRDEVRTGPRAGSSAAPAKAARSAEIDGRYRRIGIPAVAAAIACRGARKR